MMNRKQVGCLRTKKLGTEMVTKLALMVELAYYSIHTTFDLVSLDFILEPFSFDLLKFHFVYLLDKLERVFNRSHVLHE